MFKIAIIGGGAAGFFTGANLSSAFDVHIFEKSKAPLQKLRVSGGGRCNVSNACFEPNLLTENYPRGNKELRSVFGRFQPGDTMAWFEERGVALKVQEDMRIFPASDNSATIIECFVKENQKRNTNIHLSEAVKNIYKKGDNFTLETTQQTYEFDYVVVTTGNNAQMWRILKDMGHKIVSPVPSLFTFKCNDGRIKDLQGSVFKDAFLQIQSSKYNNTGDLLITHWGFSGPATLVLSAWAARELAEKKYNFKLKINFTNSTTQEVLNQLLQEKKQNTKRLIGKQIPLGLTKRFWLQLLDYLAINPQKHLSETGNKELRKIAESLTQSIFEIKGKSTFKDEFVTAGGVDLKEINFKTMESKHIPHLFLAGEAINIDAVTGGFNFQACWSESYIIANYLNSKLK